MLGRDCLSFCGFALSAAIAGAQPLTFQSTDWPGLASSSAAADAELVLKGPEVEDTSVPGVDGMMARPESGLMRRVLKVESITKLIETLAGEDTPAIDRLASEQQAELTAMVVDFAQAQRVYRRDHGPEMRRLRTMVRESDPRQGGTPPNEREDGPTESELTQAKLNLALLEQSAPRETDLWKQVYSKLSEDQQRRADDLIDQIEMDARRQNELRRIDRIRKERLDTARAALPDGEEEMATLLAEVPKPVRTRILRLPEGRRIAALELYQRAQAKKDEPEAPAAAEPAPQRMERPLEDTRRAAPRAVPVDPPSMDTVAVPSPDTPEVTEGTPKESGRDEAGGNTPNR